MTSISKLEDSSEEERPAATTPRPHWGYREILTLGAIGLLAQWASVGGATMVVQSATGLNGSEAYDLLWSEPRLLVLMQLAVWLPVMGYIWLVVTRKFGRSLASGLAWQQVPRSVRTYIRVGALLAIFSVLASIAFHDRTESSPMQDLLARREHFLVFAAFGVLAAPLLEELTFRGFIFAALEHAHGPWAAVIATSAVFATLHGAQYAWRPTNLALLFVIGMAFGVVRKCTGSTKASTVVHAAYNGFLFLVLMAFPGGVA